MWIELELEVDYKIKPSIRLGCDTLRQIIV